MDESEQGWIEINEPGLRRVIEYGRELRRIKEGVRTLAAEVDALDVEGSSVLASQLLELIDPLKYLQSGTESLIVGQEPKHPQQERQEP